MNSRSERRGLRGSIETHVLKVERLAVDAFHWRSDPVGKLSELGDAAAHERLHIGIVLGTGQPLKFVSLPLFFGENFAGEADEVSGEIADLAMKAFVRQGQSEWNAGLVDDTLPAIYAGLDFFDVIVAQPFVERGEGGN